jgi:DNA uptake protein ComE-like DNA-binding protein
VISLKQLVLVGLSVCALSAAQGNAQVGRNNGLVNPDLAGAAELAALPGMNATLAGNLVAKRPFASMMEVNALLSSALDKDQLTQLYGRLFLPLNLNKASREEILLVPGVGPRIAHEFEEYRPYRSMAQFRKEIGKYVDEKEVARLEQYVFVPINLNTASDEDILTIPGMGKRMLHEFKEYRPYKTIEQFRKEIGKYVDQKEVARLERYVTIQ